MLKRGSSGPEVPAKRKNRREDRRRAKTIKKPYKGELHLRISRNVRGLGKIKSKGTGKSIIERVEEKCQRVLNIR